MPKTPKVTRRTVLKGSAAAAGAALVAKSRPGPRSQTAEAAAAQMGPSTKTMPYVLPTASNVELTSVITVGESAGNGYRMVGIPDGLGAFANDSETFTLLMNHELVSTAGITRSHGSKGAFVSQWLVDRKTLRVLEGMDHAAGTAGGLRLGHRRQEVQRRPGDAQPPLLRRPAGSQRAVLRQQGHDGPHLPQRRRGLFTAAPGPASSPAPTRASSGSCRSSVASPSKTLSPTPEARA